MGRFIFTDCLVHWGSHANKIVSSWWNSMFLPNINLVCNNSKSSTFEIKAETNTKKKIPMDHSDLIYWSLALRSPMSTCTAHQPSPKSPRSVDLVNKANAEFQELPFSQAAIAALYLSFTGDCQVGRWVSLPHGENKEFMTRKGTILIEM